MLDLSSLFFCLATAMVVVWVCQGIRQIRYLKDVERKSLDLLPTYSIVIAARNEAESLESSVEKLLQQSLPAKELIVVDDRSDDETPHILKKLKSIYPQLLTVRIDELPRGWLGKNHALWKGIEKASGEYVLFSDGDVLFERAAMYKALSYVVKHDRLDHLSVVPDIVCPTSILKTMMTYFSFSFWMAFRLWLVRDTRSKAFVGIGAFNLVKRSSYDKIGGHQAIAMRPDDDLKLGKLLKDNCLRSDVLSGRDQVKVLWYPSLKDMFKGLEKNVFSGFNYRFFFACAGICALLVGQVFPIFLALFLGFTWASVFLILSSAAWIVGAAYSNHKHGYPKIYAWSFSVGAFLFALIAGRAVLKNTRDGGIYWRGTFYSLDDLRGE